MTDGERLTTVPCPHYNRQCNLIAPCCGRVTCCHRGTHCNQPFDRSRVTTVVCTACGRAQPLGRRCRYCRSTFGRHYCRTCVQWSNSDAFHCSRCGHCIRGRREHTRHCDRCGKCYPLSSREHTCAPIASARCAAGCNESMGESRQRLFTPPCGHAMHEQCFLRRVLLNFSCPRSDCRKPIADIGTWRSAVASNRTTTCSVFVHCNSCGLTLRTRVNRGTPVCSACGSSNACIVPPGSPVSGESSSSRLRRR